MNAGRSSRRLVPFALLTVAAGSSVTIGQTVGPDLISSSHVDVARNGVSANGQVIAYSIGSITCNRGDMPLNASPDSVTRPLVAQEMFRLKTYSSNGTNYQRFEQVGQGWVKWVGVPVSGTSATCGTGVCGGSPGAGQMGTNCADTYGSGFNGPAGMAMRSRVNAATGALTGARGGGTGDTNTMTRLQVLASDVTGQPAGTRFFVETTHVLPHDAQFLRPGQNVAVNALNNASSQEININSGTSSPTLMGGQANQQIPALQRWRDIDPAVTFVSVDHDDTVNPGAPTKFIRCRYYVAGKATALGAGNTGPWRYEYVVYNLNSDRGAGSFTIPFPAGATLTEFTFKHPPYHSGEPISNTPWTVTPSGNALVFATQTFAANPNANAVRWGTGYNFGFTANVAPTSGAGTIGLFKPGTIPSLTVPSLPVPTLPPPCLADFNASGHLDPDDLSDFITAFFVVPADPRTDFDGNGSIDPDDLNSYITAYFAGCA